MRKILIILTIAILSMNIISALNPESLTVLSQEDTIRGETKEIIIRARNQTSIYKTLIEINTTSGISISKSEFDERNQLIVLFDIGEDTELGENKIKITSTDERTLSKEIIFIVEDPQTKEEIIDEQDKTIKYLIWALAGLGFLVIFIIILTLVLIDLNKQR